ncbi:MAG TPA: transglutaminase domain-containing protein [Pirellulaceae bacterium]|nr:transglutaminase domain-containing protein [Pirellulaceae bacterium]
MFGKTAVSRFARLFLLFSPLVAWPASAEEAKPKQRAFRLDYGATLTGLPEGSQVRVWLPVPQTNEDQTVKALDRKLPGRASEAEEPKYGNRILSFTSAAPPSGEMTFSTAYEVARHEVRGLPGEMIGMGRKLTDEQKQLFLAAEKLVPTGGKSLDLIKGVELPMEKLLAARMLYDRVDDHMKYDKSQPGWGRGDVEWACDSRFGNCTDFHSLFISLARAQGLPSRFEIGLSIPIERGKGAVTGYHCWAFFYLDGHGWVPVDISEADKDPSLKDYYFGRLTEDRVTFSVGRDLTLVPKQAGEPLNFFVHPYVEVDGKQWPNEKIKLQMAYQDLDSQQGSKK